MKFSRFQDSSIEGRPALWFQSESDWVWMRSDYLPKVESFTNIFFWEHGYESVTLKREKTFRASFLRYMILQDMKPQLVTKLNGKVKWHIFLLKWVNFTFIDYVNWHIMEYVDVSGQTHPSSFSLEYLVDFQEQANIFLQNSTNCKERAFLLKRYLYSIKYFFSSC